MKKLIFILLLTVQFSQFVIGQEKTDLETLISQQWFEYSKSFEYEDYENIAKHFTYPITFNYANEPLILTNKEELIRLYKYFRINIQNGYKYSLLESYKVNQLSEKMVNIHAFYSRFNSAYERIYSGSGVYSYKKVNGEWKMYAVQSINQL